MKILRDAFSNAPKTRSFSAKPRKPDSKTNWSSGEQVQGIVRELIDQPNPVFEIVKKVLEK